MQGDHQMDIPDALNPTRPFAICVLIATNVYSLTKDRVWRLTGDSVERDMTHFKFMYSNSWAGVCQEMGPPLLCCWRRQLQCNNSGSEHSCLERDCQASSAYSDREAETVQNRPLHFARLCDIKIKIFPNVLADCCYIILQRCQNRVVGPNLEIQFWAQPCSVRISWKDSEAPSGDWPAVAGFSLLCTICRWLGPWSGGGSRALFACGRGLDEGRANHMPHNSIGILGTRWSHVLQSEQEDQQRVHKMLRQTQRIVLRVPKRQDIVYSKSNTMCAHSVHSSKTSVHRMHPPPPPPPKYALRVHGPHFQVCVHCTH